MPCGDITESIKIVVDYDNRLESYSLSKRTCGGTVGDKSLIFDSVRGCSLETIYQKSLYDFSSKNQTGNEIEDYLRLKHFRAIRAVIDVFLGYSSGGVDDNCTISGIEYDNGLTIVKAELKSTLAVDRIKSCDHCGPT